jgi:hypothetical protein
VLKELIYSNRGSSNGNYVVLQSINRINGELEIFGIVEADFLFRNA